VLVTICKSKIICLSHNFYLVIFLPFGWALVCFYVYIILPIEHKVKRFDKKICSISIICTLAQKYSLSIIYNSQLRENGVEQGKRIWKKLPLMQEL
jgi:hypothetical protein